MSEIKEFIKTNKLSFEEGSRNTTVTTLIGYGQHLGITKKNLEQELASQIKKDSFIQEEIDRLWTYCLRNSYKNYWDTPKARKAYKF